MLRRLLDPGSVFFLVAWPVLLVVFQTRGLTDPGTFWHPRVGELIVTSGFMTTDPFTFPFASSCTPCKRSAGGMPS
jgi:hypothetical protein